VSTTRFIEVGELGTCAISADGSGVRLNLIDAEGRETSVSIALDKLQALALTIPGILAEARAAAHGNPAAQPVHAVKAWTVEDGTQGRVILTFMTADHLQVAYAVHEDQVHKMADLIVEHEIEAYPEGLCFH
jgi:hypothetical protein